MLPPFEQKVLRLAIYNPKQMINSIKCFSNVAHAYSILDKYFPMRVGIEIEGIISHNFEFEKNVLPKTGEMFYDQSSNAFEIRFSFEGFKYLSRLLLFMESFVPNYEYGIHIHIDGKGIDINNSKVFPNDLVAYLIDVFKYKGKYNTPCASNAKTAVKFHQKYKSIEYRIFHMTNSYSEIVRWILILQYCNHCLRQQIQWNKNKIQEFINL
jgi:hypothetical protein